MEWEFSKQNCFSRTEFPFVICFVGLDFHVSLFFRMTQVCHIVLICDLKRKKLCVCVCVYARASVCMGMCACVCEETRRQT